MEPFVSTILTIGAALTAVPVTFFLIETIAAVALSGRRVVLPNSTPNNLRPRIAVLVPAHDESAGLRPTLADVKQKLRSGDRLLVVADNCTDDTAVVASACSAEVVERHDPAHLGKGYALDFGLRHLDLDPPGIVIFLDADCSIAGDALDELAMMSAATHRPVQSLYLMTAPAGARINYQVAEFAWRVKNWLRPLGLRALGLPCQLMGVGMAFPWDVIRSVDLANGWIVEDLKLGLDLASMGHAPVFCPSARLMSQFAPSASGSRTQRQRWESGHIKMILKTAPQLLKKAVTTRNWNLLVLTLDLSVPPLSLLALLVSVMFAIALLCAVMGFASPALALSAVTLVAFLLAACVAWLKCGRDVVPIDSLLLIARYIVGKIGLYVAIFFNKTTGSWIRTGRTNSE